MAGERDLLVEYLQLQEKVCSLSFLVASGLATRLSRAEILNDSEFAFLGACLELARFVDEKGPGGKFQRVIRELQRREGAAILEGILAADLDGSVDVDLSELTPGRRRDDPPGE